MCVNMDWILLAEDMDKWQSVVNAGMKLWFPYGVWNLLTS
jgi:hypothetical protein